MAATCCEAFNPERAVDHARDCPTRARGRRGAVFRVWSDPGGNHSFDLSAAANRLTLVRASVRWRLGQASYGTVLVDTFGNTATAPMALHLATLGRNGFSLEP